MASTSSSSSATPPQLIDNIIQLHANRTPSNSELQGLEQLIAHIQGFLDFYDSKSSQPHRSSVFNPFRKNRNPSHPTSASLGECLPSASDASIAAEGLNKSVQALSTQISAYTGETEGTAINVLNAIGNVHWVAVGFLLVAAVIQRIDTVKSNKEKCVDLLKRMMKLAKTIMIFKDLPRLERETELHITIKECIELIFQGAVSCCSRKARKGFPSFLSASSDKAVLENAGTQMDEKRQQLLLLVTSSHYVSTMLSSMPQVPPPNDAVGIDDQIAKVVQLLDWEDAKPTVGVVVYGIGGSGKTTLAGEVYASLKDKLQLGWRHSKVTLIQNLETEANVEGLQSQILEDLTGTKRTVRDFQSGQRYLKDIMEKESIFLYIDNALHMEPLEKLLPKQLTSAKKLRLLVTARETNVSGAIEDCGIEPCKLYSMESLSDDAALEVLCRKIDRKRDTSSIVNERPLAKKIAKKCSCCPLFLEVVGGFIHQRKNNVEAYQSVINYLESGEDFSGTKKYSFDESRVLFSYNGLNRNAQEAFLDICSFFYDWECEEVAWIVGEEEFECLQEGALLKNKDGTISIHDLILSAGRNKCKDSRFTTASELSKALKKKEELVSQIKGVWLRYEYRESTFHISAEALDTMSTSLRVFVMGNLTIVEGKCKRQFEELRYFQVGTVPNLPMDISNLKNLSYIHYAFGKDMILSSSKNLSNLKVLIFQKCNDSRIIGIESPHLHNLKQLVLYGCNGAEIPQTFYKLSDLQKLELSRCLDVEELPESLCKLSSLKDLNLSGCQKMKRLSAGFGELGSLTTLNLSGCKSLQELPCDLEKLSSLKSLNLTDCFSLLQLPERLGSLTSLTSLEIKGCKSLSSFPHSIGHLTSFSPSYINFNGCSSLRELPEEICKYTMLKSISLVGCSSLRELPEEICKYTMLKSISLGGCSSLKMLPSRFSELTCLQTLDLRGCESLQQLCNDFHCLIDLKRIYMEGCKSLSSLPLGFGKISSLENLDLTGCGKLEQLCSDFHLGALKYLTLSKCFSLSNLPDCFGQLGCLETLKLRGCSNLEKLSEDFRCLRSLTKLYLSECESLGGEWMDSVVAIPSLWRLDIAGSERMIQRWTELKNEKEKWHFVVVKDFSAEDTEERCRALLLEGAISKVFDEEAGLLFDNHQRPFRSSFLQPHIFTPLIFIIYPYDALSSSFWEILEKRIEQVECNSKLFQIIYVGSPDFDALPSELAARILAHTPPSFCHKLYANFPIPGGICVSRSTVGLDANRIRCLSGWEDISWVDDEVEFLSRTPRESNIELLTALLVTEKTDYILFNKNQQVKVADLQGKIILLLTAPLRTSEMWTSALKDMYFQMQKTHKSLVEVVWTPEVYFSSSTWEEYERATANAPWPMVPDPWSMNSHLRNLSVYKRTPEVLIVDGKGRLRREDALPMIERYGVQAYPFSESREEQLVNAEWEGFNCNSQSTLEFIFQNMEFLQTKAKEVTSRGEMMLVCVGSDTKMMEFAAPLITALSMLESDARVLYVAHSLGLQDSDSREENDEYELKRMEISSTIPSLSFSDVFRFWRRVRYLQHDLNRIGTDEKIAKVRRMVLGLASADCNCEENEMGILSIVVVDENGEMICGRGMELVQLLCHGDEDNKEKLLIDIKSEGFEKAMGIRRWRDGMTHPKHNTEHPLLKLKH
ncbi:hypothetical protein KI387_033859, partial [Taxus chinensis]